MTLIVHRTPGLIDPRAFTLMGVSAKPNAGGHPIGMFGTGLKYAVATLVRMGAGVTIWIGRDRYQFETHNEDFRGQEVQRIVFYRTRWGGLRRTRHVLPFTSSYGRFWTTWMALRELHSNTIDEGGETYPCTNVTMGGEPWVREDSGEVITPADGFTMIVVDHPEYAEAWAKVGDIFLPGASRQKAAESSVEMLENADPEHSRLYFRGLRVYDLPKPSIYTYNFTCDMQLTEDRTLASVYSARRVLAEAVLKSDDREFIQAILKAKEDQWEHELEFPSWITPGDTFRSFMLQSDRRHVSRSSWSYFGEYTPKPVKTRKAVSAVWDSYPGPWKVKDELVLDADSNEVFKQPDDMDSDDWDLIAPAIISRCGRAETTGDDSEDPDVIPMESPEMTAEEAETNSEVEEMFDPSGEEREAHEAQHLMPDADNEDLGV